MYFGVGVIFCGFFQPKVFSKEALTTFFTTFDRSCPYQLVRAAYAVVYYLGGHRVAEIKSLKRGSKYRVYNAHKFILKVTCAV